MSSQDQDVVDKVFSLGYSLITQGNRAISEATSTVIKKVQKIGDDVRNPSYERNGNVREITGGSRGVLDFLSRRRKSIFWGFGLTALGVLACWQFKSLMNVPPHLPQSEKKCVLVLGDMRDPIIRSQVMDLYRRRFVVFVCTANAKTRGKFEIHEEDDFLRFIDPSSSSDLAGFVQFVSKKNEERCDLASILFMPNLSYYPSGEMSITQLNAEIEANVLMYYATISKLLPHLKSNTTQLLLFNPSLSYNLSISHHPAEIMISALIQSVYRSLHGHPHLKVYMIHIGMLQLAAQPSNYKYLHLSGSNINDSMLQPVYKLVMAHQGNWLVKSIEWFRTLGFFKPILYCGKFSFLSTLPLAKLFLWN